MPTVAEIFDQALRHYQSGQLGLAENLCRQVLHANPQFGHAWYLLGVMARQIGRPILAIEYIGQALRFIPGFAEAHNNLGIILREQGKLEEAQACYRQAIGHKPDYAEAHDNLGVLLQERGRLQEAELCLRDALRCNPSYARAHYHLGIALREQGKLEEAKACYRQAIQLKPDYAEAHGNLGVILQEQGRLQEGEVCLREALRSNPGHARAYYNLGISLREQHKPEEAEACFSQAIRLRRNYAEAHSNLGVVLRDQGRLEEAEACFRDALRLRPDLAGTHSNMLCTLLYSPHCDVRTIIEEHQRWNRQHAEPLTRYRESHANERSTGRRLRLGYISPDFRDHVVGRNMLPLMRHHDGRQFDVTLYANLARADDMTLQFQKHVHRWHTTTGWTDSQLADQIKEDRVDILVDLALHTAGNRLLALARRPAPVQVTFAGYPGSTGMPAIDYRLSDPYLDPPGMFDACYAEETYRLPHSFWCYDPQTSEPPVAALPASANGYITFGCLNNFCKVNASTLILWTKVLRILDSSRLILLAPEGKHRQRVLDVLEAEGIDAGRISFVAPQPRLRYLEQYGRIDLALDTLPYNGHTTSLDAYWMGVPVVTLVGQTVVGRAGFSQLSNLNLCELAASTEDEFVSIVVNLAQDLARLGQLRAGLRARMQSSPLMDAAAFARDIEAAYCDMWQRWCNRNLGF